MHRLARTYLGLYIFFTGLQLPRELVEHLPVGEQDVAPFTRRGEDHSWVANVMIDGEDTDGTAEHVRVRSCCGSRVLVARRVPAIEFSPEDRHGTFWTLWVATCLKNPRTPGRSHTTSTCRSGVPRIRRDRMTRRTVEDDDDKVRLVPSGRPKKRV